MIDDILAARKISEIADQSNEIEKKSDEMEKILYNAFCYLELQFENGLEFRKKDALNKMMDALQSADEKILNMPGNKDFTDEQIDSVQDPFELMELIVTMHKNALKKNDACKRYLEMVSQISYWMLRECKSEQIPLPNGYKLSKMIQKEGFMLKYPKPTDLLQGKEPTFDVTE